MTQGNTLSVNLCGVTLDASEAGAALFQDGDRTCDSMIGRRFGRYVLTQRLGAGSMGIVYAAHDPALDRTVAIKILSPFDGDRRAHLEARLRREAQALARLDHPNVVVVHDIGVDDGRLYIVMRRVDGATLADRLADARRRDIVRLYLAAGEGLAAAHDAGLVHRDFKPSNVLVDHRDRVFVVDFGLASSSDIAPGTFGADAFDEDGVIVGTPFYMSPEQLRGEPATARSDQFAFAVSLWVSLFGCHPYGTRCEDMSAVLTRMKSDDPLAVSDVSVPPRVYVALQRALRHDPEARWPSLHALLGELVPRPRRRRRVPLAVSSSVVTARLSPASLR
jgi:serine/threonine protein kinase